MGAKKFYDIEELVTQTDKKPAYSVQMGFRTSGKIHIGNLMTFLNMFLIGKKLKETGKIFEYNPTIVAIDLALATPKDDSKIGLVFNHFPDNNNCHKSYAEHNIAFAEEFLKEASELTGIPYKLFTYSKDVDGNAQFRAFIAEQILKKQNGLYELVGGKKRYVEKESKKTELNTVPFDIVCPKCNAISIDRFVNYSSYHNGSLVAECKNTFCEIPIRANILDTDIQLVPNYLVNLALRTKFFSPDLYVVGGDYDGATMDNIGQLIDFMGVEEQRFFISPLVVGKDGKKIGKSEQNLIPLSRVKERLGKDYVSVLLSVTEELQKEQFTVIPYVLIEEKTKIKLVD